MRALLRSIAILAAYVLTAGPGLACSFAPDVNPPTPESNFKAASTVIAAHLTKVEELPFNKFGYETFLEGTFRTIEVLKGQPPADQKVRSFPYGPGNCTIPLVVGVDYLFYLFESPQAELKSMVTWPSGSEAYLNIDAEGPREILQRLRALK